MLETLSPEDFDAIGAQPLVLSGSHAQLPVEIAEVRRIKSPSLRAQPFSVVFRHRDARQHAAQGIYRLDLPGHGAVDLFVVPIGPDGKGMCYEAVFN